MKEYLVKNKNDQYVLMNDVTCIPSELVIEIPEGAIRARFYPADPDAGIEFENQFAQWWNTDELEWIYYMDQASYNHSRIVWQRQTHPEELPFVDDYFIVKDNKALFDKIRSGAIQVKFVDDEPIKRMKAQDEVVSIPKSELEKFGFSVSLNDQYAEIEKVRQNSKLDQSISDFKNTDHGKEFDEPDFDELERLLIETTKHKPTQEEIDNVNHPSHYASGEIECIDAMEAMLTPEQFIGYLRGNAFKYQWRYENKGGITDLEKAQWYLNKLISRIG